MNQRQLLRNWNFPHLVHGGVTLVAREDAERVLQTILKQQCRLHGYEGFTLHQDGRIQPHLEFSASWSWDNLPPLYTILGDVLGSPVEVTHFEFVFSASA
jgi:hypothetical protein